MSQAKNGDTVKITYTCKLTDGTVCDTTEGREPLEFQIGEGQILPAFEEAVIGMEQGQTKTVTISAADAYGPYQEELVFQVGHDAFPPDFKAEKGQRLELNPQEGPNIVVTVLDVDDSGIQLDANHPLAGQDLTFELELAEIA